MASGIEKKVLIGLTLCDVIGDSLGVVVHDDVATFDPHRNLSLRYQEFVELSPVANDEVAYGQFYKKSFCCN